MTWSEEHLQPTKLILRLKPNSFGRDCLQTDGAALTMTQQAWDEREEFGEDLLSAFHHETYWNLHHLAHLRLAGLPSPAEERNHHAATHHREHMIQKLNFLTHRYGIEKEDVPRFPHNPEENEGTDSMFRLQYSLSLRLIKTQALMAAKSASPRPPPGKKLAQVVVCVFFRGHDLLPAESQRDRWPRPHRKRGQCFWLAFCDEDGCVFGVVPAHTSRGSHVLQSPELLERGITQWRRDNPRVGPPAGEVMFNPGGETPIDFGPQAASLDALGLGWTRRMM